MFCAGRERFKLALAGSWESQAMERRSRGLTKTNVATTAKKATKYEVFLMVGLRWPLGE